VPFVDEYLCLSERQQGIELQEVQYPATKVERLPSTVTSYWVAAVNGLNIFSGIFGEFAKFRKKSRLKVVP
jgi:hypothetical protein